MERDADVLCLSVLFPSLQVVEDVCRAHHAAFSIDPVIENRLHIMKHVVVDVVHAQPLQLLRENRLDLVLALQCEGREFGGYQELLTGIPLHNGPAHGILTFPIVVHIAGVKVVVAGRHKRIHHWIKLLKVDLSRGVLFHRQAHHAKSKFSCFHIHTSR